MSQRGLLATVAWTLGEDVGAGNTVGPVPRKAYALEGSAFIAGALDLQSAAARQARASSRRR